MDVERVKNLGEAILAVLNEDIQEHGASFETFAIQIDTMAGVVHATLVAVRKITTPSIAVAMAARFRSLAKLDEAARG